MSQFAGIMNAVALPALFRVFGVLATHTNAEGDEASANVILKTELAAVGQYGERMEERMTLAVAKTLGAALDDTFAIPNLPTDDDPAPDPTVWKITQLLTDDGYLQKFAALETVE